MSKSVNQHLTGIMPEQEKKARYARSYSFDHRMHQKLSALAKMFRDTNISALTEYYVNRGMEADGLVPVIKPVKPEPLPPFKPGPHKPNYD